MSPVESKSLSVMREAASRYAVASRGGISRRQRTLHFESLESRMLLAADASLIAAPLAEGEGPPMPDFVLLDTNSTSPSHEQSVSPRDYLQQVSAWYFGHAL